MTTTAKTAAKAPRKLRPYWALVSRFGSNPLWCLQFGDKDRDAVVVEMACFRQDDRRLGLTDNHYRIVKCRTASKANVAAAIAQLVSTLAHVETLKARVAGQRETSPTSDDVRAASARQGFTGWTSIEAGFEIPQAGSCETPTVESDDGSTVIYAPPVEPVPSSRSADKA